MYQTNKLLVFLPFATHYSQLLVTRYRYQLLVLLLATTRYCYQLLVLLLATIRYCYQLLVLLLATIL